jgi:hypothetical protein
VFLGRAGGHPAKSFGPNIVDVYAVKSAAIELDHTPAKQRIDVPPYLTVRTKEAVPHDFTVSCGIPGHGFLGQEIRAEILRIQDDPFDFDFRGKCGFAAEFKYAS